MLVLDTDFVAFGSPGSERACASSSSSAVFRELCFWLSVMMYTWTPHSADRGREIKFKVTLSGTVN